MEITANPFRGYPARPPSAYESPFASLVPSAFPPGTDPNVIACFQMADQDGSGFIDDEELQLAFSLYDQSYPTTDHLLRELQANITRPILRFPTTTGAIITSPILCTTQIAELLAESLNLTDHRVLLRGRARIWNTEHNHSPIGNDEVVNPGAEQISDGMPPPPPPPESNPPTPNGTQPAGTNPGPDPLPPPPPPRLYSNPPSPNGTQPAGTNARPEHISIGMPPGSPPPPPPPQSDDAVRAAIGIGVQTCGAVVAHGITNPSGFSPIISTTAVLGLGLTLAGNATRHGRPKLSRFLIKTGALSTAAAVILSVVMPIPHLAASIVGPVGFIIAGIGVYHFKF